MAQLDKDRIAATALAIVDKRGLSGFTIRAVAEALGVTPMALYHHVADKAELAALVVKATSSKHPLAALTGDWREDLWTMARWMREMTIAHPAGQELRRRYRIYTPDILRMADRWLSLWQQSGLDQKKALLAATTSSMAIAGLLAEESLARELDTPDPASVAQMPNARMLLHAKNDPQVVFELAVRSLVDGLHTRLLHGRTPRARAAKSKKPTSRKK